MFLARLTAIVLSVSLLTACSSESGGDTTGSGGAGGSGGSGGGDPGPPEPIGGTERPVTVYVPKSYDGSTKVPLLLLLHGYTATGMQQEAYMNFLPIAQERGFLYAHPDGTKDQDGYQFWNATDACCDFYDTQVDDSAYLARVIGDIQARYAVDPDRIYLVGHSNGGYMSFRMACDHADLIAGIASLAGATWNDDSKCNPSEPVSVLAIHGTADTDVLYEGSSIAGDTYPGAMTTATTWAKHDGCSEQTDTSAPPVEIDGSIAGAETNVTKWTDGCKAGSAVELWTVEGGGHLPFPLAEDFATKVVDWLFAHPKKP